MPLENPSKLEKLKITAFDSAHRTKQVGKVFEAMFNPESYQQKYAIEYESEQTLGSGGKEAQFRYSPPGELSIDLILDGSGVETIGGSGPGLRRSVADRIQHFLDTAYNINGKVHQPNWLRVQWGKHLKFDARLLEASIQYSAFAPSGDPLRATISATFTTDDETVKRLKREDKKSPDLTHHRIVLESDTLPQLSQEIYGSPDYFLWIAEANGLDHFRRLQPGQELVFPPLPTP